MTEHQAEQLRVRLFLDSGVIIQGCVSPWGAAKAILILATLRDRFTVILAEAVEREVQRSVNRKAAELGVEQAAEVVASVNGWLARVRLERHPFPSADLIRARLPLLLPALRHINDLPAVVTAMEVKPDWVISANPEHWNPDLATRARLRVVTPLGFLQHLRVEKDPASNA